MFTFMDWVAYQQGQYGCSSPSTKVIHDQSALFQCSITMLRRNLFMTSDQIQLHCKVQLQIWTVAQFEVGRCDSHVTQWAADSAMDYFPNLQTSPFTCELAF